MIADRQQTGHNLKPLMTYSMASILALATYAVHADETVVPNSYIVKFRASTPNAPSPVLPAVRRGVESPFDQPTSGQTKEQLATALGLRGQVKYIYDAINAANLTIDDEEAASLTKDPRVLRVEKNHWGTTSTTQSNPGWALDRIDQTSLTLNSAYTYNNTGAGFTIYIIDTGLDLSKAGVIAEFGSRASILWDINGGTGADCNSHGTMVASTAAGATKGTAKGATLQIAKITGGCTGSSSEADWTLAFNWLATNASSGSIANLSSSVYNPNNACATNVTQTLDDSIDAAHDAGVIVVIAAGNDGCDTSLFSMSKNPKAFVVGASDFLNLGSNFDAKWPSSRIGSNISTYAPRVNVSVIDQNGTATISSGTSFSAPLIAGLFAVGCQYYGVCDLLSTDPQRATAAYNTMRSFTQAVVFSTSGSYLPGWTTGAPLVVKPTW